MEYRTYELLRIPYAYQNFKENSPPSPAVIHEIRTAYAELSAYVEGLLANSTPSQTLIPVLLNVREKVETHLAACLRQGETVTPEIPTPIAAAVKAFYSRADSDLGDRKLVKDNNFAIQAFAALLFEVRSLWSIYPAPDIIALPPNVIVELSSYAMWRAAEQSKISGEDILGLQYFERKRLETVESEVTDFLKSQTKRMEQSDSEFAGKIEKLEETLRLLENENQSARTKISDQTAMLVAIQEQSDGLKRQIDESSDALSGFDAALEERLKGVAMAGLWRVRAQANEKAFRYSAMLVAALIIIPPAYAITHIETVVDILRRVGNAAVQGIPEGATNTLLTVATISRLVVITAPLGLYFWAIKLLIRFNTRSMILMDDARQRNTTMSTYYHLVKRNVISSQEERGLMLNALFRPLPGHGPENVDPPNFLEIMGKKSD